jgi:hypothetical protein
VLDSALGVDSTTSIFDAMDGKLAAILIEELDDASVGMMNAQVISPGDRPDWRRVLTDRVAGRT